MEFFELSQKELNVLTLENILHLFGLLVIPLPTAVGTKRLWTSLPNLSKQSGEYGELSEPWPTIQFLSTQLCRSMTVRLKLEHVLFHDVDFL